MAPMDLSVNPLTSPAPWRSILHSRVPATPRLILGFALLLAVWYLLIRPLTSLTILSIACGAALIAVGLGLIISRGGNPKPSPRFLRYLWQRLAPGALCLVAGVISCVAWNSLLALFLTIALALGASLTATAATRGRLARTVLLLLVTGLMGVIALRWADVASIMVHWAFMAALVWVAAMLILPPPNKVSRGVVGTVCAALAICLLGSVTAGGLLLDAQQPRIDNFYSWKGQLPSTPGTLLAVSNYDGEAPTGSRTMRILYTTKDVRDTVRVASAVVALPTAPATQPRTVLAWQHGTTGVAAPCAPSLGNNAVNNVGIPGIDNAIKRGWAVIATDYPGQGTTGPYPYLVGVGEGRATLDGIRALGQVSGADISNNVMLWGHSQGGHATLWAADLAQSYAPELHILGVAALSAAWDPYFLAQDIASKKGSPVKSLIFSYVLLPYADAYPDVRVTDVVDPAGVPFARSSASRCTVFPNTLLSILTASLLTQDRPLYTLDLNDSPASKRLKENAAAANFSAPLFLGQGTDDEVVPILSQRNLAKKVCVPGRAVSVHEYARRSHMGVVAPDSPLIGDLYKWADAVVAGQLPHACTP